MFNKVSIIMGWVSDIDAAVHFYRDVCGLHAVHISKDWSQFDLGNGLSLGIHPGRASAQEVASREHNQGWTLGFEVEDIVAARKRLEEANALIHSDYHDIPGGVTVETADPDGNSISVMQMGITTADLRR